MEIERKYIFVTGGVLSGLGKGVAAASLGRLLKARGFKVANIKFDAYINVDPGNMSLSRHGEVFVTDDGGECDLDIGNYERFVDENLPGESNSTMGRVFLNVIKRERERGYGGEDVQVIPHVTDEIKRHIHSAAESASAEIAIVEIGGTVGDIESLPLLEAIRQMSFDVGRENAVFIHLTLVPNVNDEMKSKPTQRSVKELLSYGIQPDIIICRSGKELTSSIKEKIALFCNVRKESVIQNKDVECIYDIPHLLEKEGLAKLVCEKLGTGNPAPDLKEWLDFCERRKKAKKTADIAIVGKYMETKEAYQSVKEALIHAATHAGLRLNLHWVDAEKTERHAAALSSVAGIIIPPGFGKRGVDGMVTAAGFARAKKIPFLGIGLGMHSAVIEYARNVLGLDDADSSEYKVTSKPIVDIIPESGPGNGGTMRRGACGITLLPGTLINKAYGGDAASERHRHRYEVNPSFRELLDGGGMAVSAVSMDNTRIEAVELPRPCHPWFLGVQFHPEFKSRPNRPHPIFVEFINAVLDVQNIHGKRKIDN